MKFVLVALVALTSSAAFAGRLDVETYNYESEAFFPKVDQRCQDGETQMFVEAKPGLDRYINVIRTCKDGVYYPRKVTKARACKEGAVAFWSVARNGLDRYDNVKFVCVGGKYVRK